MAAPDGGVALCVERNEELMIAESSASLERAVERSLEELRAARSRDGPARPRGTTHLCCASSTRLSALYSEPDRCPEEPSACSHAESQKNPSFVSF